jgi:hypothetical protein
MVNTGMALTEKQERYCQLSAIGTYADAYREAYSPSANYDWRPDVSALNKNPRIAHRILEIQYGTPKPIANAREFLLNWHFLRFVYDPAELTAWAFEACRHCYGEGNGYQWRPSEYAKALAEAERDSMPIPDLAGGFGFNATLPPVKECVECDGRGRGRANFADTGSLSPSARAAFEGVKQTKDGLEIRMADKQKAAESFGKLCGLDVVQIKTLVEDVPDAVELRALRADPDGAIRLYTALVAGGSARALLN